ncbi:MAG: DUF1559 domain-containing protein [Planctomycetaceae bacterium]|nr:DUF1559 domain-containing protein [Planctomycetaceae bacterium]
MKRVLVILCLIVLAAATFLPWRGLDGGVFFSLMIAWVHGLARLPGWLMHNPVTAAIGLAALVLLPFALHRFVYHAFKTGNPEFKFKKSLAFAAGFCALAMTAIAMITIVHAIHWSIYSKEPLFYSHTVGQERDINIMKQLGLGMHNYHDAHKTLPSGGTILKDGRAGHGWMTYLTPYVGGEGFSELDLDKPWYESPNDRVYKNSIPHPYVNDIHSQTLRHDSSGQAIKNADGFITTDFAANEHALPLGRSLSFANFTDGTSNTLMIGEAGKNQQPWGSPFNSRDPAIGLNSSPWGFNGTHPGVVIFSMADGSAIPISETTDSRILEALSTPNGGEW